MNNLAGNAAREDVAASAAVHGDFHFPSDDTRFRVANVVELHSESCPWRATRAVFGPPSRMDGRRQRPSLSWHWNGISCQRFYRVVCRVLAALHPSRMRPLAPTVTYRVNADSNSHSNGNACRNYFPNGSRLGQRHPQVAPTIPPGGLVANLPSGSMKSFGLLLTNKYAESSRLL